MKKADLVNKLVETSGLSKSKAEEGLSAVLDAIQSGISDGDGVTIAGFGTFSVQDRAARNGINPRTGESIRIPASKHVKFKASKTFKDRVAA